MIVNLLIAGVLLIATLFGLFLVQRRIKGEGIALPLTAGKKQQEASGTVDLEQFIAAYRRDKEAADHAIGQPAAAASPAVAASAAAASPPLLKPKEGFLSGPNKLLYLVLKAALPDHQMFANVRLSDSVQLAGQPATPHARAQLAQARIDFLVCNKALAIVAYIDISDGNRADDVLKRQIEPFFNSSGARYLRVPPTAIPRPAEVRALICSE